MAATSIQLMSASDYFLQPACYVNRNPFRPDWTTRIGSETVRPTSAPEKDERPARSRVTLSKRHAGQGSIRIPKPVRLIDHIVSAAAKRESTSSSSLPPPEQHYDYRKRGPTPSWIQVPRRRRSKSTNGMVEKEVFVGTGKDGKIVFGEGIPPTPIEPSPHGKRETQLSTQLSALEPRSKYSYDGENSLFNYDSEDRETNAPERDSFPLTISTSSMIVNDPTLAKSIQLGHPDSRTGQQMRHDDFKVLSAIVKPLPAVLARTPPASAKESRPMGRIVQSQMTVADGTAQKKGTEKDRELYERRREVQGHNITWSLCNDVMGDKPISEQRDGLELDDLTERKQQASGSSKKNPSDSAVSAHQPPLTLTSLEGKIAALCRTRYGRDERARPERSKKFEQAHAETETTVRAPLAILPFEITKSVAKQKPKKKRSFPKFKSSLKFQPLSPSTASDSVKSLRSNLTCCSAEWYTPCTTPPGSSELHENVLPVTPMQSHIHVLETTFSRRLSLEPNPTFPTAALLPTQAQLLPQPKTPDPPPPEPTKASKPAHVIDGFAFPPVPSRAPSPRSFHPDHAASRPATASSAAALRNGNDNDNDNNNSSSIDGPLTAISARTRMRLEALERENRLLEAALMAVLKATGKLNRCPCGGDFDASAHTDSMAAGVCSGYTSISGGSSLQCEAESEGGSGLGARALELYMNTRN